MRLSKIEILVAAGIVVVLLTIVAITSLYGCPAGECLEEREDGSTAMCAGYTPEGMCIGYVFSPNYTCVKRAAPPYCRPKGLSRWKLTREGDEY